MESLLGPFGTGMVSGAEAKLTLKSIRKHRETNIFRNIIFIVSVSDHPVVYGQFAIGHISQIVVMGYNDICLFVLFTEGEK